MVAFRPAAIVSVGNVNDASATSRLVDADSDVGRREALCVVTLISALRRLQSAVGEACAGVRPTSIMAGGAELQTFAMAVHTDVSTTRQSSAVARRRGGSVEACDDQ